MEQNPSRFIGAVLNHWYVIRSKPNKEEFLYEQLCIRKIDTYYPYIKTQPANPRARKRKPYFPGYLFIRADLERIGVSTLQWTPGALGLVDFGGQLASVPNDILEKIRSKVDRFNELGFEKNCRFKSGDLVKIQSGPFVGYHAIFDSHISGYERVRVLLQLLHNRQIGVELADAQLEKLG